MVENKMENTFCCTNVVREIYKISKVCCVNCLNKTKLCINIYVFIVTIVFVLKHFQFH